MIDLFLILFFLSLAYLLDGILSAWESTDTEGLQVCMAVFEG